MSVNQVQIVGNTGSAIELRHTASGKKVANFNVATSWGSGRDAVTEWHRIVAWERTAEFCAERVKKGAKVAIFGRLQTRKYTDDNGTERYTTEIVANAVEVFS